MSIISAQAALWTAVILSGVYHGTNPAMGWPLAVSNAMMNRRGRAMLPALGWLGLGHALAILVVMLPFGALAELLRWQRQIQIGASLLLIGFGLFLLSVRKHPRALVRIAPSKLASWSFAVAIAHGAGLMLVPIYLGLCTPSEDHRAAMVLIHSNIAMAIIVSIAHATAMVASGGLIAWAVYRFLGIEFLTRSWLNLELVWASSLLLVGLASLGMNLGLKAV